MLDPKSVDELARRLTASLPPGVREFQEEVEKNVKTTLQAGLSRLDLVTREEFDAQAKVLARTRAQLEALADRVEELERGGSGGGKSGSGGGKSGGAGGKSGKASSGS